MGTRKVLELTSMMQANSCCCCINDLRTAVLILGVLGAVGGIFGLTETPRSGWGTAIFIAGWLGYFQTIGNIIFCGYGTCSAWKYDGKGVMLYARWSMLTIVISFAIYLIVAIGMPPVCNAVAEKVEEGIALEQWCSQNKMNSTDIYYYDEKCNDERRAEQWQQLGHPLSEETRRQLISVSSMSPVLAPF